VDGIDDSKQLTEAQREALFGPIRSSALAHAVAAVSPAVIDRINIRRASLKAMAQACGVVRRMRPELGGALVLIDGRDRAPLPRGVEQRPLIQGDARSLNIAAASILAKVTRDRMMLRYHERWPVYGFDRHKGYPTPQHLEALRKHGPCPIHRRSFRMPGPGGAEP
jgi:ribonuclease HII